MSNPNANKKNTKPVTPEEEDDLFAPITQEERDLFAPISEEERGAVLQQEQADTADQDLFAPIKDTELAAIEEEIEKRSILDRPALGAEYTKRSEVEAIARKYGVDPARLTELAPYFGARLEGTEFFSPEEVKRTAGAFGKVALGIPQKLYKLAQDPKMEAALDDLQALVSGRESYLQSAAELAAPIGQIKAGQALLPTAAKLAGIGAVSGAASSRAGEEVSGAATGAALTAGIGTLATKVVQHLGKRAAKAAGEVAEEVSEKLPKAEEQVVRATLEDPTAKAQIEEGVKEVLERRAASEKIIEDKILTSEKSIKLSKAEVDTIVREQYSPEALAQYMNPETALGKSVRRNIVDADPTVEEYLIRKKLAKDVIRNRTRDVASDMEKGPKPRGFKSAKKVINEWASMQGGQDAVRSKLRLAREAEAAAEHINEKAISIGRADNFGEKAKNFISDAQFVLRDIADRFGVAAETVHQKLNKGVNRMSFPRLQHRKAIDTIYRAASKAGIDEELVKGDKIYKALDTGDFSQLSEPEKSAAAQVKKFFSDGIDFVNKLVTEKDPDVAPLSIKKMENYIPHMRKATPDLVLAFEQKQREVLEEASDLLGKAVTDVRQLTTSDLNALKVKAETAAAKGISTPTNDLLVGLRSLEAAPVSNGDQLYRTLRQTFHTREGRNALQTTARSAFERKGDIPMFMRETNIYKLMDGWSQNTLKHLYLRQPMDELANISKMVRAAGGAQESRYINNLLTDIIGVRQGTAAELALNRKTDFLKSMDRLQAKATNPISKAAFGALKALPDVFEDLNKQIYPNLLGLSPRALLQNLTQAWAKTAPELGTRYGYFTVIRGVAHAVLNFKKQAARIEQLGFVPAEFVAKYNRAVADGIRRSSLYALPLDVVQKMGDVAMFLYTRTDQLNRMIALSTADIMANDLTKKSGKVKALAQMSLRKFSPEIQKAVNAAGTAEQKAEVIGTYLSAATQYNYNRASMSEYGRVMGPFFSTFSKWPTATAGEIISDIRSKGLIKGGWRDANKFILPLMMFKGMDYVLSGGAPEEERSDRFKKLLGSGGLAGAAPVGSIKGMITGEFFTPPAIDAITQSVILPVFREGRPVNPAVGIGNAVGQFTPGAVYVRFLTDDAVTLLTGERPSGSSFVERTAEGARRLTQ